MQYTVHKSRMIPSLTLTLVLSLLFTSITLDARGRRPVLEPPRDKYDKAAWIHYWQEVEREQVLARGTAASHRKRGIHNGNRVQTLFYNYGSIGKPNTEPSMEWPIGSGRGYAFEFGVLAGARVLKYQGDPTNTSDYLEIVCDGLTIAGVRGSNADNTIAPDWEPLPGYADPNQQFIPLSDAPDLDRDIYGRPDSWPERWGEVITDQETGEQIKVYYWPGEYGKGVTTADQESYYVMDDFWIKRHNAYNPRPEGSNINEEDWLWSEELSPEEFYPDTTNYVRGGLGLEVLSRGYQWTATRAQNVIFFVYELTNTGTDTLEDVYFGMYGDPHIGGANDYADDNAYYDTFLDLVYAWDHNARGEPQYFGSSAPGFFGYKFLESPGEPRDFKDNDADGLVDESMQDDIDNDGDFEPFDDFNMNGRWDPGEDINDDVGTDGIGPEDRYYPGPDPDGSEANGLPDHGEPDFDETDLDEADQIGLTAFVVKQYTAQTRTDAEYYDFLTAGIIDENFEQNEDNIFMYSSGPIIMAPNDTRRFSIAMLFGYNTQGAGDEDLPENEQNTADLYATANVMQDIYNAGYRFVKPPDKPRVTVVPGDKEVTLYWDRTAELSKDPLYGNDFEGYAIYRATDIGFNEVFDVTDAYGNPKLWTPIAKFDKENGIRGLHPIELIKGSGLHYDLGTDNGLVHSYVDRSVTNGVRYFYAVCAYDSGAVQDTIPPTETSKTIKEVYGNLELDINTVVVTPQAPSVGYVAPEIILDDSPLDGPGTGTVAVEILDPRLVPDGRTLEIRFKDTSMDEADNDGDWASFSDDTLFIPNSDYATIIVLPSTDSTIASMDEPDTLLVKRQYDPLFLKHGVVWRIDSTKLGSNKDTVFLNPFDIAIGPTAGLWDPDVDGSVNQDVGIDGCSDEYEDGFGGCSPTPIVGVFPGDDPNEDNYHPTLNPTGTEANGRPEAGEPGIDADDMDELIRNTVSFSVVDVTEPSTPITVLENQTDLEGGDGNTTLYGMQFFIENDAVEDEDDLDSTATGWVNGNCTWDPVIVVSEVNNVDGLPWPGTYQLELSDVVIDSSHNLIQGSRNPLTYTVSELLSDRRVPLQIQNNRGDSALVGGTRMTFLQFKDDSNTGDSTRTWQVEFRPRMPLVSDILSVADGIFVCTTKPDDGVSTGLHFYHRQSDTWQNWTKKNTGGALLADQIWDIETYDGRYWIATEIGPVIFDGTLWQRNIRIETLVDSLQGGIENVATDPEKTKAYASTIGIERDLQGNIWLATKFDGLIYLDYKATYNTSLDDSISVIVPPDTLPDGSEWPIPIATKEAYELFISSDNTLYLGTRGGVIVYHVSTGEWETILTDDGLPNSRVRAIDEIPGYGMVFGTEKGIAFGSQDTSGVWTFTVFDEDTGHLTNKRVLSMAYQEVDGNKYLWVGTKEGLSQLDLTADSGDLTNVTSTLHFGSFGTTTITQDGNIAAIAFSEDGTGWFGTTEGVEQRLGVDSWDTFGPEPGDVFQFKTRMPFSHFDSYQFVTSGPREDEQIVENDLSKVSVVPNPYVATAVWEPKPFLQSGRGDRKIYFINLPERCTIRIYTLSGELVRKLEHDSTVFDGSEPWDLLNNDQLEVAYGIYLYHIEAENAEHIGKLALIK